MLRTPLLESFWEAELFGSGYALSNVSWWVDGIVLAIVVVLFGGLYFLFVWLLGRMKLTQEDKEIYKINIFIYIIIALLNCSIFYANNFMG